MLLAGRVASPPAVPQSPAPPRVPGPSRPARVRGRAVQSRVSPFRVSPFRVSPFRVSPFGASQFRASPFRDSPLRRPRAFPSVTASCLGRLGFGEMHSARPGHIPGAHRGVGRQLHGRHGVILLRPPVSCKRRITQHPSLDPSSLDPSSRDLGHYPPFPSATPQRNQGYPPGTRESGPAGVGQPRRGRGTVGRCGVAKSGAGQSCRGSRARPLPCGGSGTSCCCGAGRRSARWAPRSPSSPCH